MLIEEVRKLSTVDRFMYFVNERESIRLKKEAGEPQPWTDDEILKTYRFTNVRRMDDRVSIWLLENWYKPFFNHPNMLAACSVARFINLPSALVQITESMFEKTPNFNEIKKILRKIKDEGHTIFNGAYMVRGNDGQDKVASVIDYYVGSLDCFYQDWNVGYTLEDTDSMEHSWNELVKNGYGFGSFMAGQVIADCRWAMEGEWKDRNDWAPIGPGSKKGMNLLQGRPENQLLKQEQFLDELKAVRNIGIKRLPESITSRLEMQDWQNCFCEYFKYSKCLNGGRAKQLYKAKT